MSVLLSASLGQDLLFLTAVYGWQTSLGDASDSPVSATGVMRHEHGILLSTGVTVFTWNLDIRAQILILA